MTRPQAPLAFRLTPQSGAILAALAGTAAVVASTLSMTSQAEARQPASPRVTHPYRASQPISPSMPEVASSGAYGRTQPVQSQTSPAAPAPAEPAPPPAVEAPATPTPAANPEAFDMASIAAMMGAGGPGGSGPDDNFTPWDQLSKGFRQVSSAGDQGSLYGVWVNDQDNRMLLELPSGFEYQKHFIAVTLAAGDAYAGLQVADFYVYWRRLGDRLMLIQPTLNIRSTGDAASQASTQRLFTDRVLMDLPIMGMGPSGQPVIDANSFLAGNTSTFFGSWGARSDLARIAKAKAFPQNVELAFEMPAAGGVLQTFHYSLSVIPEYSDYQPRVADERVGYFTTGYADLGQVDPSSMYVRYINRWKLEKADPSLRMSPAREPIVFYIDHATPVRYRRWIRQGIEYWNTAFEAVGILNAIEVRQQDATTGAYMDLDPEDVRYNFIRWLANGEGTAIGPSRVNPNTGQILDADIVLTDGFIRAFWQTHEKLLPSIAMNGMNPQTLEWLAQNPAWDPRVRLAPPSERGMVAASIQQQRGVLRYGGHPAGNTGGSVLGDDAYDGLAGRVSQTNGLCLAGQGAMLNMATMRLQLDVLSQAAIAAASDPDDNTIPPEILEYYRNNPQVVDMLPAEVQAKVRALLAAAETPSGDADAQESHAAVEDGPGGDLIDGVPEAFLGPQLADLTAHEVGHTLGLRHNFKGSSIYSLDEINSEQLAGKTVWTGSVMDYHGWNIRVEAGDRQGDYGPIGIGPYDMWVIEYGYGSGDPAEVAGRCADPMLAYATDEDTWDADPTARQWDLSSNPLDYAMEKIRLAEFHRRQLLDHFVKDGQSWSRARQGYGLTLGQQLTAVNIMAQWIGGAYIHRDKRGDANARPPVVPVEAQRQRDALAFILEHSFRDDAYGLTPEILQHMGLDKWWDDGGFATIFQDTPYPIHDTILGIQASTLTMLLNPMTLTRVFDNEYRTPPDQDMLTLPEVITAITDEVWSEMNGPRTGTYSARNPMISSLRRNLQTEHLGRLIELSMPGKMGGSAAEPVRTLATAELRRLLQRIPAPNANPPGIDPYTSAHLADARSRIERALDATYIYNSNDIGGGGFYSPLFGQPVPQTRP